MTYRARLLLVGMTTLTLAAAFPALADVYTVTYTGTASGTDKFGVFGTAEATLNNVAFTATYSYNPLLFGSAQVQSTPGWEAVVGGSYYHLDDPFLGASLTIGGRTY